MAIPRLRNIDPPPAEVLSQTELDRAIRYKRAYALCATTGGDCIWEAARIVDRLQFVAWLIEAGRIGKGDRN